MSNLEGRAVLVAGATRGIARALGEADVDNLPGEPALFGANPGYANELGSPARALGFDPGHADETLASAKRSG